MELRKRLGIRKLKHQSGVCCPILAGLTSNDIRACFRSFASACHTRSPSYHMSQGNPMGRNGEWPLSRSRLPARPVPGIQTLPHLLCTSVNCVFVAPFGMPESFVGVT